MVWIQAGFAMTILSASIKAIPDDIVEAAKLDGVNGLKMFRYITVPSIRPSLIVVLTTISITTLKVFDIVRTATGGNFDTSVLAYEFYVQSFRSFNSGLGAALAMLLFVLVIPIVVYNIRQMRQAGGTMTTTTPTAPQRRAGRLAQERPAAAAARRACLAVGLARSPISSPSCGRCPTFGLLVSSFRPEADIKTNGWWNVFTDPQFTLDNYRQVLSGSGHRPGDVLHQLGGHHHPGGAHPDQPGHDGGVRLRVDPRSRAATCSSSRSSPCRSCRSRSP